MGPGRSSEPSPSGPPVALSCAGQGPAIFRISRFLRESLPRGASFLKAAEFRVGKLKLQRPCHLPFTSFQKSFFSLFLPSGGARKSPGMRVLISQDRGASCWCACGVNSLKIFGYGLVSWRPSRGGDGRGCEKNQRLDWYGEEGNGFFREILFGGREIGGAGAISPGSTGGNAVA